MLILGKGAFGIVVGFRHGARLHSRFVGQLRILVTSCDGRGTMASAVEIMAEPIGPGEDKIRCTVCGSVAAKVLVAAARPYCTYLRAATVTPVIPSGAPMATSGTDVPNPLAALLQDAGPLDNSFGAILVGTYVTLV